MADLRWTHRVEGFFSGIAEDSSTVELRTAAVRRIAETETVCLHFRGTPYADYTGGSGSGGLQTFNGFNDGTDPTVVQRNAADFQMHGEDLVMESAEALFIRLAPYNTDSAASGTCTVTITDILGITSLSFTLNPGSEFLWSPGGNPVDLVSTSAIEFSFSPPVNLVLDFYLAGRKPVAP